MVVSSSESPLFYSEYNCPIQGIRALFLLKTELLQKNNFDTLQIMPIFLLFLRGSLDCVDTISEIEEFHEAGIVFPFLSGLLLSNRQPA